MRRILLNSTSYFQLLLASLSLGGLNACGGDTGGRVSAAPPAITTAASASLGVVLNASVNFYQADGVTLIGSADTGSTGTVSVPVSNYSGPVIIEVRGDADASYFDESLASPVAFGSGQVIRALISAPGGEVAVTLLTELAYQLALNAGQIPVTANQADAANEAVRAALAPGLSSILSVPATFDASTTSGSLNDNEAGRYALVLAALAELGNGQAAPALAVLNALVADLADGRIDGQNDGTAISVPYNDFINEMSAALTQMAGSYGSAALQGNASAQAPSSTTVGDQGNGGNPSGPNGTTRAASVNVALQSQYTLTMGEAQAGAPFDNGDLLMVIVGSDDSLTIGDAAPLTQPFERQIGGSFNSAEIIWLDADNQLEYALSNNSTGSFNEVNIGDATNPQANGTPAFLGQLRIADVEAPVDPEQGNAGKARLTGNNGFTGVIDGNEFTFLDTAQVLPNNSGDGILRIEASAAGDVTTKWRLFVPETPGTYICADTADERVLQFIHAGGFGAANGSATGDGSCSIKLTRNDGGIVEGYFVGELENRPNDPLRVVTDGYFYIDSNPQSTGGLAAGESGMHYSVGGTQFVIQPAAVLANTPNFDYVTLNVGPGAALSQFFRFANETGTYQCGQGPSFRNFYVVFQHQGKTYRGAGANTTEPAGSSCSFTVTQVGTMQSSGGDYSGTVEASFSGTFIASDGASLTVSDGFVRAFGNQ